MEVKIEQVIPELTKPQKSMVKIAASVIIGGFLLFNSVYTLKENQVAVLKTFGQPESITTAGIHFKIPFVQNVYKLSSEIRGMQIGYDDNNQSIISESEMITKDFNN